MKMISPFNDDQALAINTRGVSILVSAPAGSGKTKILVSRIMSLIMEDHYSVDEFLVLTFTQAAAAEMKQRLLFAIEDELKKDLPQDQYEHLLKQKEKIPYAYITNFHGFCSQLLKKYGYLIGVEPGFEILSDPTLIKYEVLDECIENWIQEKEFKDFISLYYNDMHFENFKSMMMNLYEIIHSIDDVQGFVQEIKTTIYDDYINSDQDFTHWKNFPQIKRLLENQTIASYNDLIELETFASTHHIQDFLERPEEQTEKAQALPVPVEMMYNYIEERFKLLKQDYLSYDHFRQVSFRPMEKSYAIKWDDDTKPYQKEFNAKKSKVTKGYLDLAKTYLPENEDDFKMLLKESYYVIDKLLGDHGLVYRFKTAYQLKKQELGVLDFNDLEQNTIQLLQKNYPIASLLYSKLKEIMIDEYQDTNQIQETIISLIKDYKQPSIISFRVGDMKQSIYRFRQADPQLFKEKYDTFSLNEQDSLKTKTRRIDLHYNYRSNKIVLDSVNYIFNQIMDSQVGGLEYLHDDSSQLNYDYLRKEGCKSLDELEATTLKVDERIENEHRFDTEVLLIDRDQLGDLSEGEYEAHLAALKIKKLMQESSLKTFSGDNRPIEYKDIVVLMRSTTLFLTFKKVFDLYHIPNHIVLSQGFLNAVEVMNVIISLRAILQPNDDVAFVSFLRAPYLFSHFDEQMLTTIRKQVQDQSVYEALLLYQEQVQEPKIQSFLETFDLLQKEIYTKSPSVFLSDFLDLSGYTIFCENLINGDQRKANLDLLLEEFKSLEQTKDLYEIVEEYREKIKKQSAASPAQMISSSDNVVQFMTIHKSKGLEFPIVFVSNMDKGFNKQDSTKRMIIDKQYGIAIKPRIAKTIEFMNGEWIDQIVEYENPYRKLLARIQNEEAINEEMRIFYVALTRASQKLILTGVSEKEAILKWQNQVLLNENSEIYDGKKNKHILLYYNARKANTYLDWVGAALMRHPQILQQGILNEDEEIAKNFKKIARLKSVKDYQFNNTKAAKFTLDLINPQELEKEMILKHAPSFKEELPKIILESLPTFDHYSKTTSVTALQAKQITTTFGYQIDLPNDDLSPTQKGTLVHGFLEHLPLNEQPAKQTIDSLYQKGLYDDQELAVLYDYLDKINTFKQSQVFKLMLESDQVWKEKSFSLLDETTSQVVHGIFDVVCFKDQQITIIDYKTDRVKKDTKEYYLKENHRIQMEYYKQLLQRVYPDYSIQAIVYYLEIGKYVIV